MDPSTRTHRIHLPLRNWEQHFRYTAPVTVNGKAYDNVAIWPVGMAGGSNAAHYCVHTFGDMCGDTIAPVGQQVVVEELRVPLPEVRFYVFEEITPGLDGDSMAEWYNAHPDGGTGGATCSVRCVGLRLAGTPIEAQTLAWNVCSIERKPTWYIVGKRTCLM